MGLIERIVEKVNDFVKEIPITPSLTIEILKSVLSVYRTNWGHYELDTIENDNGNSIDIDVYWTELNPKTMKRVTKKITHLVIIYSKYREGIFVSHIIYDC